MNLSRRGIDVPVTASIKDEPQEPIPTGWKWARLADVCKLINGDRSSNYPSKNDRVASGIPFINAGHLVGGRIDISEMDYISEDCFAKLSSGKVAEGDILYCLRGSLGKAALVRGISAGAIASSLVIIRPATGIRPHYLTHYVDSPGARASIQLFDNGTAQPNLSARDLGKFWVPVPPPAEQERIVAAIEEQFSRLEAGVVALERARQNLKRLRGAVLRAAVSGRLVPQDATEGRGSDHLSAQETRRRFTRGMPTPTLDDQIIPSTWAVAYMEDLADRITVGHVGPMQSEYVPSGVPFLRSQNVRPNRFDPEGLKYISPEFHRRLEKSALLPGDVVVVRSGNVGTACVVPEDLGEANCSDLVVIQRPRGINPDFAAYYMNSMAQRYVRAGRVGVALTHFNTKSVAALPVPVPPLTEQRRIVAETDRQLSIISQTEALLDRLELRAAASRSSILAAAFSGRLVAQEPTDEPASVLLARIAADRAAPNPNGRKPTRKPNQERLPL